MTEFQEKVLHELINIILIVIVVMLFFMAHCTKAAEVYPDTLYIMVDEDGKLASTRLPTVGVKQGMAVMRAIPTTQVVFTDSTDTYKCRVTYHYGTPAEWGEIIEFWLPGFWGQYQAGTMRTDSGLVYSFRHEYDFNRNGLVDLSDMGRFGLTPRTPTEMEIMSQVWQKGYYEWRAK